MATLAPFRVAIADAITVAGVPAYPVVPERLTPPAVAVLPDDPYITPAEATGCGAWGIHGRAVILGGKGTNQTATDALDGLLETVLAALDQFDNVHVDSVAEPVEVALNGATYLGTVITFTSIQQIGA